MGQTVEFTPVKLYEVCDDSDLEWVAGWLEGEGSFCLVVDGRNPKWRSLKISAASTDEDVITQVADILGTRLYGPYSMKKYGENCLERWTIALSGRDAYIWMVRLLPFMRGQRRTYDMIALIDEFRHKYA